jgi:hypothetical protein
LIKSLRVALNFSLLVFLLKNALLQFSSMPTKKPDQDLVNTVLFLAFCGACLWGWLGPKPKYPHPPGSVLYVIQTSCVMQPYETDRMICEMTKTDEWMKTHPKSEWFWSPYP